MKSTLLNLNPACVCVSVFDIESFNKMFYPVLHSFCPVGILKSH